MSAPEIWYRAPLHGYYIEEVEVSRFNSTHVWLVYGTREEKRKRKTAIDEIVPTAAVAKERLLAKLISERDDLQTKLTSVTDRIMHLEERGVKLVRPSRRSTYPSINSI